MRMSGKSVITCRALAVIWKSITTSFTTLLGSIQKWCQVNSKTFSTPSPSLSYTYALGLMPCCHKMLYPLFAWHHFWMTPHRVSVTLNPQYRVAIWIKDAQLPKTFDHRIHTCPVIEKHTIGITVSYWCSLNAIWLPFDYWTDNQMAWVSWSSIIRNHNINGPFK